ncbi:putative DUF1104 domain-containing protein [Azospirillaceae bacterium]
MKRIVLALIVLTGLLVGPTSGQAQTMPVQPTTARASETHEVYPSELMTFRERFAMWRAMRAAQTPDERMELMMRNRVEMEKRAIEKGVRLREMGPMMNGSRDGSRNYEGRRWSGSEGRGQMRMGMHGQPHPPMGR